MGLRISDTWIRRSVKDNRRDRRHTCKERIKVGRRGKRGKKEEKREERKKGS